MANSARAVTATARTIHMALLVVVPEAVSVRTTPTARLGKLEATPVVASAKMIHMVLRDALEEALAKTTPTVLAAVPEATLVVVMHRTVPAPVAA